MLQTLIQTLKEASLIMLNAHDVKNNTEQKSERNFVTVYDTKVQNYIKNKLQNIYSDIHFIGEEEDCNATDPYTNKCFICDPIDGTANFRRTYKHSAISLAYEENGKIIMGVVINPYLNEIFYAQKGKGAYLNGQRIFVSDSPLNESFLSFGTSPYYPELSKKTTEILSNVIHDVEDIRRTGSAALDLCYLACGRHDIFFELSLFPWDYAASSVIITEAGGIITDEAQNIPPLHKRTTIVAGNKIAYKEFFDRNYLI